MGGYVAGRADLVELAAERLTVPGIGSECGASLGVNRTLFQGFFFAPHTVSQALKTMAFAAGMLEELDESLIDAGSAVAGCGGAFACLFMEALADGAVYAGLPRQKAQRYAAQMLLGTAKLALEGGGHTAAMKDAICSPGGTTIAGVRTLEQRGFRAAAMDAVIAAYERTKALQ